jgi:hypothetical protein
MNAEIRVRHVERANVHAHRINTTKTSRLSAHFLEHSELVVGHTHRYINCELS